MRSSVLLRLLLILVFPFQSVIAQRIFAPGYILKTSGDTLRAEILDTDRTDFESVTYRMSPSAEEIRLTPGQADGYGINGGRKFLSIASTALERESKFYEVLVSGKASLYLMDSRFMLKVNDTYYELKNGSREEVVNGKPYQRETYPFRGVLNFALQDCPAVKKSIKVVILSEANLVRIVNKYNGCFGGSKQLDNYVEGRFGGGFYGGLVSQSFKYSRPEGPALPWLEGTSPSSSTVSVGVFAKYSFTTKWWTSFDFNYFATDLTFSSDRVNGSERQHDDMKYKGSNLNVQALIHYSFRTLGLVPYVHAGPTIAWTFNEASSRDNTIYTTIGSTIITSPMVHHDPLYTSNFSFGVTGGAGLVWRSESKWSPFIETRVSFLGGPTTDNTDTSINRLGLSIVGGIMLN